MSDKLVKRMLRVREDVSKVVDYLVCFDQTHEDVLLLLQHCVDRIRDYALPFGFGGCTLDGHPFYIDIDGARYSTPEKDYYLKPTRKIIGSRLKK